MSPKFIVAEVSRTWKRLEGYAVCQLFETVIDSNLQRGYHLKDWKFSQIVQDSVLTETIIAVFEKKDS